MNHVRRRQLLECPHPPAAAKIVSLARVVPCDGALAHSTRPVPEGFRGRACPTPELAAFPANVGSECSAALDKLNDMLRRTLWRWELAAFALLIGLFNLPLLTGAFSTRFIFHPAAASSGEWWRVITHPFVHVSWYHLALDTAAFFLAYLELQQRQGRERLGLVAAAGAGSLLVALAASPLIVTQGLCGLSGIAHGLTAVVSLELLRRSDDWASRWSGLIGFAGVTGKSLFELVTGNVLFASWHLGWLGTPIAACHAGGILGAVTVWLLLPRDTKSSTLPGLD